MIIAVIQVKWDEFRREVRSWRNKHRQDQLASVDRAQERPISILQIRYGYTMENGPQN